MEQLKYTIDEAKKRIEDYFEIMNWQDVASALHSGNDGGKYSKIRYIACLRYILMTKPMPSAHRECGERLLDVARYLEI